MSDEAKLETQDKLVSETIMKDTSENSPEEKHHYYHHHHHLKFQMDPKFACTPLDSFTEMEAFLKEPPPWRTLCQPLTPHSKRKIRNIDIQRLQMKDPGYSPQLDLPDYFCHVNIEKDDDDTYIDVQYYDEKELPKTLVCHDMANGYHDDHYIHGTGNYDAYTFYNWAAIDIFCYFSHHFITIPPLGWINVAHAHGVKVIGTVITEWAEGVVLWDKILNSEESYKKFASALVTIAKTLHFEGWLLNIENKISKPQLLLEFVKHLHTVLHEEIPDAELIWYDSVTIHGILNWQNTLNSMNRDFFEACDGIFTNYSWNERDLQGGMAEAGSRLLDVYVGIDVWGRNFFGGGHFNTQQAVELVHKYGCSLAIFAPAWTHEAIGSEQRDENSVAMAEELDRLHLWRLRDRALWGSLWPFLHTRLPARLPLVTSFCRGMGLRYWALGEPVSDTPWFNLRLQQYQPNCAHGPHAYLLAPEQHLAAVCAAAGEPCRALADVPSSTSCTGSLKRKVHDVFSRICKRARPRSAYGSGKELHKKRKEDAQREEQRAAVQAQHEHEHREHEHGKEGKPDSPAAPSDLLHYSRTRETSARLRLGQSVGGARYGLAYLREERECMEPWLRDAFGGGGCLRVAPAAPGAPRSLTLLRLDAPVPHSLVVCVASKPAGGEGSLGLRLELEGGAAVALLEGPLEAGAPPPAPAVAYALDPASDEFRRLQRCLLVCHNSFYVPVENAFGWCVRYYVVAGGGARLATVSLRPQAPHLLGLVGLCARAALCDRDHPAPPAPPAPAPERASPTVSGPISKPLFLN